MAKQIGRRAFALGSAMAAVASKAIAQPLGSSTASSAVSLGFSSPGTVGFPAILRGSLDGVTYFKKTGGVLGFGQTTAQRQTNLLQLQAAINAAIAGNLYFEMEECIIEINGSAGLLIPAQGFSANGFLWRGSRTGTQIYQYYTGGTGAPVLTIGDTTGVTTFAGLDFDGGLFAYGTAVTGLTSALTVTAGPVAWGRITGLNVGVGANPYPGYDGFVLNTNNTQMFFSNTLDGWQVNGAQRNLFNLNNSMGTGNRFNNIYLNGGQSNVYNALTGNYVTFGTLIGTENSFGQLNCEWGACNILMDIEGAYGVTFECLHIEGIRLTGANPILMQTANTRAKIISMEVDDCQINSSYFSGTAKIFRDYTPMGSNISVDNLNFIAFTSGMINTGFTVMAPDTPSTDVGAYSVNKMQFQDQTGTSQFASVSIDSHMPVTSGFVPPERIGQYTWGISRSICDAGVYQISSNYTHYGQLTSATLIVPASVTSFTITLAATMGATGSQPPTAGTVTTVLRTAGTGSGTVLVHDDLNNTITTSSGNGLLQQYTFMFNGQHYVLITQVN